MTILVTGGAGFIGSHLCDRLLEQKEKVVALDNLDSYYSVMQKRCNIQSALQKPGYRFVEGSILEAGKLDALFRKNRFSAVVHLAALPGVRRSVLDPEATFSVNVDGTINVFRACHSHRVSNVVFASSSSVYGVQKKYPVSEMALTDNPLSPYAASKKSGELIANSFFHAYGLPVTCLRFFTVYGPRNRPDMAVHLFSDAIFNDRPVEMFGNGSSKRDYTFVADIVDAIEKTIEKKPGLDIINLGNHSPVRLDTLIQTIGNAFEKKPMIIRKPWPKSDPLVTFADNRKARKRLGWKPKIRIKEGIGAFAQWYLGSRKQLKE